MTRTLQTSLIILMAGATFSALAAEPKPDFAIKTKSIEASVFLDGKIKADAALLADRPEEALATARPTCAAIKDGPLRKMLDDRKLCRT